MKRAANIDLCRGLLFVLMANTHALTIAGVEATHWLFSDLWLPSGWATQVFVVLSGFSVGFLCASRTDHAAVQASLLRRSRQIFWVMVGSNTFFAFLRIAMTGSAGLVVRLRHARHPMDDFRRTAADRAGGVLWRLPEQGVDARALARAGGAGRGAPAGLGAGG